MLPSLQLPGNFGGVNWGSASIDEKRQLAFLLTNGMVNRPRLIPRSDPFAQSLKAAPSSELGGPHPQEGTPYAAEAPPFLSPLYVPCNQPPWGKINAVDLATGKLVWSRPIGSGRDQGPLGMASHMPFTMGIFGFGGALGTQGGVVFAGATQDHAFRAYNAATGELLFEADLPASAGATPMSYLSPASGRQFVAISSEAPGWHKDGYYALLTAYALPKQAR